MEEDHNHIEQVHVSADRLPSQQQDGSMTEPLLQRSLQQQQSLIIAEDLLASKAQNNNGVIGKRLVRVHSAPQISFLKSAPKKLQQEQGPSSTPFKSLPPLPQFYDEDSGGRMIPKAFIYLVLYLILGIFMSFSLLRDELEGTTTTIIVDTLYFAIVTMTTVGYGDLVPKNTTAKLFTVCYVFLGFGFVGVLVSGAANYLVEKQEKILVQKLYLKHKQHKEGSSVTPVLTEDDDVAEAHWKLVLSGCLVIFLLGIGILVLRYSEGLSFINAFYCACVTLTTLGYGDVSFQTVGGRLFAVFWILLGTVCVAQLFLYLAEFRTKERQHKLAHWALTRPTTFSDLEAADLDGDGIVNAAEFILYKLKELGKVDEADIVDIANEFCSLDYDQNGALKISSFHVPQATDLPA